MDKDREFSYSNEDIKQAKDIFFMLLCFWERETLCLFPEDMPTEMQIRCNRQDIITVIDLMEKSIQLL